MEPHRPSAGHRRLPPPARLAGALLGAAAVACVPLAREPAAPPPPGAPGPLGAAEVARLFASLPPLAPEPGPPQGFAERPVAAPPRPRPGSTIPASFPALPPSPPANEPRPLEVLRIVPEGDVPLASSVTVSFSEAMVPLATQEALAAERVPVRLEPALQVEARWLGTRTLSLAAKPRLPMASVLTVEVPAGTASASGARLPAARRVVFRTPPPGLVDSSPRGGDQPLSPVLVAAFDQAIEPAAVLRTIRVEARGRSLPLRLATPAELAADGGAASTMVRAGPGRAVAFVATRPLPRGSRIHVLVGPGTPSAEGPRVTTTPQSFELETFGPLALASSGCGEDEQGCEPGEPLRLEFNHDLDDELFRQEWVSVSPPLAEQVIELNGNTLVVHGKGTRRSTHRVTVAAALRDDHGQRLGANVSRIFRIRGREPSLELPGGQFVTLDRAGPPRLPAFVVNHAALKVELRRVTAADWPAWQRHLATRWDERPEPLPGRSLGRRRIPVPPARDELLELPLDLGPALDGGLGHVLVVVEPEQQPAAPEERVRFELWAQATRLGLDALADDRSLVVFATSLADGSPLAALPVELAPGPGGQTGADGVLQLSLPEGPAENGRLLVARSGADVALLPESVRGSGASWQRRSPESSTRFFVLDDRRLYRPGETARVKGLVRILAARSEPTFPEAPEPLTWELTDARGVKLGEGSTRLSATGAFDLAVPVPLATNLGEARLSLSLPRPGGKPVQHQHRLRIDEFRRPEHEVQVVASPLPMFAGGAAKLSVSARYLSGGPLGDAPVRWELAWREASFTPPGQAGFQFGRFQPFWRHDQGRRSGPGKRSLESFDGGDGWDRRTSFSGTTDAAGAQEQPWKLPQVQPEAPLSVSAAATVTDVNRQPVTAGTRFLVHPAGLYVGAATATFVEAGAPILAQLVVADLDGKRVAGIPIELRATRLAFRLGEGGIVEEEQEERACDVVSALAPVSCELSTAGAGGRHRLVAEVTDSAGRKARTELWVYEAGERPPPERTVAEEVAELVPDRRGYAPGDEAALLLRAPFFPAEALVSIQRAGILETRRLRLTGPSARIAVAITEELVPDVTVRVDLVGAAPRLDGRGRPATGQPPRPAHATAEATLPISRRTKSLAVAVRPSEPTVAPGASTELTLEVRDFSGAPVPGAELTVAVVDEAILSLTGGQGFPDPLPGFHPATGAGSSRRRGRDSLVLAGVPPEPGAGAAQRPRRGLGARERKNGHGSKKSLRLSELAVEGRDEPGGEPGELRLREDLSPLALFESSLRTDPDGRLRLPVKLPDSLTRWRVLVLAAHGPARFGNGEAAITARLPLAVRPSAPRFLRYGDAFELPVTVQNQTAAPLLVEVAARALNASLDGAAGQRLLVPANGRVEVRFPARAGAPGLARFQLVAVAGASGDAQAISLPVYAPPTTEAFATYGAIERGAVAQPLARPAGVDPAFGGLTVTTSSTELAGLTDALLYLSTYPHECAEQLASRILAVAALSDVLRAFGAEGLPSPEQLRAATERDVERLVALQDGDGGFGFWRRGEPSWPWLSVHAAHALARAKEKGFAVPEDALGRSSRHLQRIRERIPAWYSAESSRTIQAYALSTRARLGERDPRAVAALVAEGGAGLPAEAVGFLWPLAAREPSLAREAAELRRLLLNAATETAGEAHLVTGTSDGAHVLLHSERRADGIALEALLEVEPASDLAPKLTRGLLAHRTAGHWASTQESAFVLLALDRWFRAQEAVAPDFTARAWTGALFAGEVSHRGRGVDRGELFVPMAALAAGPPLQELLLEKDGPGRLTYRLGLRYAPTALALPALDRGFAVERAYLPVDDPAEVRRDADGTVRIRAGARVRVRVTMVAPSRRHHVALVDPLPAGLEAVNPAFATSERAPAPGEDGGVDLWSYPWFEHQALRDDRAEAFRSLLREGVYRYEYLARATTPGRFTAPPARAEEMYAPETSGRSATDTVVIEEAARDSRCGKPGACAGTGILSP